MALYTVDICLKPVMHHQCTLSVGLCYRSIPQLWDTVRPWDHQCTLSVVGLCCRRICLKPVMCGIISSHYLWGFALDLFIDPVMPFVLGIISAVSVAPLFRFLPPV